MKKEAIIALFKKVGLILQILTEPIRRGKGLELIFQMDIASIKKGISRYEKFRMYMPENVEVQVRDTDLKAKQVLIMVNEPRVQFEDFRSFSGEATKQTVLSRVQSAKGVKITRVTKNRVFFTRYTDEATRYFLMGVDERQLFIAQLKGAATTITEARKSLGASVQFAEGRRRNSVDRQGEWFFLETSENFRDTLERAITKNKCAIRSRVNIGEYFNRRGGNPHNAYELVVLPSAILAPADTKMVRESGNRIFVRGSIRHKDHKTLHFSHWREVVANNEASDTASGVVQSRGVFWVD